MVSKVYKSRLCLAYCLVRAPFEQIRSKRGLPHTTGSLNIFDTIEGGKYADIETRLCMKDEGCESSHILGKTLIMFLFSKFRFPGIMFLNIFYFILCRLSEYI